jgi:two-component system LytT family response regulator
MTHDPQVAHEPPGAHAAPPQLRVVVVDDEPLIREGLSAMLAAEPGVRVVASCPDGASALAAVRQHAPEVLFLDVQMPGMDGLAVARALATTSPAPVVVFVTAHERYAVAAFEVSAVDYLLKPFDEMRVRESVRRVRARLAGGDVGALRAHLAALLTRLDGADAAVGVPPASHEAAVSAPARVPPERLLVGIAQGTRVVWIKDVEWIEAADNYAIVHSVDGAGLLREPLKSLEARLDPTRFARVHRSAIVNLTRVRQLRLLRGGDYALTLRSGAIVTMSRTYRDDVLHRLR